MKDTKFGSRLFGIAFIISNFMFLFFKGYRIIEYDLMIANETIMESTLQHIILLDNLAAITSYIIVLIAFLTALYLMEELFHSTLHKDCSVLLMTSLVCILVSLMTIVCLKQPITLLQEHLSFMPYFLIVLALISIINHFKKRYIRSMQSI